MHRSRKDGTAVLFDSERKHLTLREMERLLEAVHGSRNEARDHCLLLLMFRHGLRVSEACGLKLDQVDTESHSFMLCDSSGVIDHAALARRRTARLPLGSRNAPGSNQTAKALFVSQ